MGLEPRLPVDRNLLYSDRVSEYREAYPVRRRIRTHQAWKQLVQRLLRHFGARTRWFVWNWIGCDRSWRNTVLGRVELRFFRSLDHLVLVREFSPEDVGETAGWSLSSGTMLNTSPRHTSGAHVRSPRGGRERGSSVPIMDAETRRRVDPFPGLGNPNPLWVQGLAQGSQPVYGPVPRGRTPARSPHGVATGAPQQTMGGPSFPPGLPQQAVGSPSLPPGLSTGPPQPVVTPSQTSPDVQGLTRQVRELEA